MDLRPAVLFPGFRLTFDVREFGTIKSLVDANETSRSLSRIVNKARINYDRNRVSIRVQMYELDELFNLLLEGKMLHDRYARQSIDLS